MTTSGGPSDRYKAVWLIFFTLGLGTLLPWNFFMTATRYFTNRLRDPQNVTSLAPFLKLNGTDKGLEPPPTYLQSKFNNAMTLCAMLPLLIFTCLNSFLHQRIPQKVRILGSLVAILLVFMMTAALVKIPLEPLPFFITTMVKIVLINSFGAILQGSLFGLAGLLPASYTAPVMSGQGMAGTFAALAMICAIASGSLLEDSAFGYFITACVAILLAIGSYIVLPRLDFFRHYSMKDKTEYRIHERHAELETKIDLIKKDETNTVEQKYTNNTDPQVPGQKSSIVSIFKKIWVMALSVCFVFTVTIGLFPAVTAEVKSSIAGGTKWELYFIPVSCFLMFNVFDWLGRSLTAVVLWHPLESPLAIGAAISCVLTGQLPPWDTREQMLPGKDSRLLPIMVAARLVFIPLFMLCNVQPRSYMPVFFLHDAWYISFIILFSISNGYLASLCMCFGPKKVLAHEAETAGAIMAFFLSLGLALGAIFSFLFRMVI